MAQEKTEVKKQFHPYGTPGFEQTLLWHDERLHDYLVIVDEKPIGEIMDARAKGTTVYEMIDVYGGIDSLTEYLAAENGDGVYGDVAGMPDFANDAEYDSIMESLANNLAALNALKAKKTETKETETQVSETQEIETEESEDVNNG